MTEPVPIMQHNKNIDDIYYYDEKTNVWECGYCGCDNPQHVDICGVCGQGRKT